MLLRNPGSWFAVRGSITAEKGGRSTNLHLHLEISARALRSYRALAELGLGYFRGACRMPRTRPSRSPITSPESRSNRPKPGGLRATLIAAFDLCPNKRRRRLHLERQ